MCKRRTPRQSKPSLQTTSKRFAENFLGSRGTPVARYRLRPGTLFVHSQQTWVFRHWRRSGQRPDRDGSQECGRTGHGYPVRSRYGGPSAVSRRLLRCRLLELALGTRSRLGSMRGGVGSSARSERSLVDRNHERHAPPSKGIPVAAGLQLVAEISEELGGQGRCRTVSCARKLHALVGNPLVLILSTARLPEQPWTVSFQHMLDH
jgi:hypothetical protein